MVVSAGQGVCSNIEKETAIQFMRKLLGKNGKALCSTAFTLLALLEQQVKSNMPGKGLKNGPM